MAEQAFDAQVSAWVAQTQERLTAVFRESTERVVEVMQTPVAKGGNMPVRTGFLRSSLQLSKDAPTPADRPNPNPDAAEGSFAYNLGPVSLVIAGAELGEQIFASYSAAYAYSVNYGTSKRAGRQFVGLAAQRWPAIVAAVCQELQSRVEGSSKTLST